MAALRDFLAFTEGNHPRDVTPWDVAGWKENLKRRGRTDSTIAHRLSALSSYYTYLQRPRPDGRPLQEHKPVQAVERGDLEVSPYERARKLSAGEFRSILAQIDTDTVMGPGIGRCSCSTSCVPAGAVRWSTYEAATCAWRARRRRAG